MLSPKIMSHGGPLALSYHPCIMRMQEVCRKVAEDVPHAFEQGDTFTKLALNIRTHATDTEEMSIRALNERILG